MRTLFAFSLLRYSLVLSVLGSAGSLVFGQHANPCDELMDTLGMSFAKPRFSNPTLLLRGIRIMLSPACENGTEPKEMMSEAIWECMTRHPDAFLEMACDLNPSERFWLSKYGSRPVHDGFLFAQIKSNMKARFGKYPCARAWYKEIEVHLPKD